MTLTEPLAPSAASPIKPVGVEGGGDDAADWTTGTYRTTFTYVTNQEQPFAQGTVAQSASFVIG